MTLELGWFSTARGEGSRRLLARVWEAIQTGELDARITVVFCNREPGESPETDRFFEQVRSYGLPLVTFSSDRFTQQWMGPPRQRRADDPWRLSFDREVMARLEAYPFELGFLAGYMLLVGQEMCERYTLLNLHPALPNGPTGTWQQVIWQLIGQGAQETGIMIHRCTEELDRGPVVTYCRYAIRGGPFEPLWEEVQGRPLHVLRRDPGEALPLFRLIRAHGLAREMPLILATLRAFSERRFRFEGRQLVDATGRPIPPQDLTDEIEAAVAPVLATLSV